MTVLRICLTVWLAVLPYRHVSGQASALPTGSIVRISPLTDVGRPRSDSTAVLRGRLAAVSADSITIDVGERPFRTARAGWRVDVLSFERRPRTFARNLPNAILIGGLVAALANSASREASSNTRTVTTLNGAVAGFVVSSVLATWKRQPRWTEVVATR